MSANLNATQHLTGQVNASGDGNLIGGRTNASGDDKIVGGRANVGTVLKGERGEPGTTFVPIVDMDGNLSWDNDGGLTNPDPVNIKGPKGDPGRMIQSDWNQHDETQPDYIKNKPTFTGEGVVGVNGATFIPAVSDDGVLSWTNDKNLPNPDPISIKGDPGKDGQDYVLTDTDKAMIAEMAAELVDVPEEGTGSSVVKIIEPAEDDIPKVFITGVKPTTKDDVLAEMDYISKTDRFHAYLKIKCQGSSSMNYAKKNFTIKIYSDEVRETKQKKRFKGWNHESDKFVLKANWIDHSHARNIISARLWDEIIKSRSNYDILPEEMRNSPNSGAVDGFPVKLYYNGTYEGIYTWNIGKDAWMWGMDEINPNHALLACGYNDNGVLLNKAGNFRALWSGVHEDNWDIEVGTQGEALTNSLNALISCVKDTDDETFKATIGNYLDINSALDYYLYFWANAGLDSLENNMLLATYDGVKWICGAYDMDSVWGLYWDGSKFIPTDFKCPDDYQGPYSLLWERITKLFVPELKARYSELRSRVLSYPNVVTHFERFMDVIGSDLYAEDLTIYTGIPSGNTNNIKQIRDFVRDRLTYVDGEIGNMSEEPDVPDTPDEPEVDEGMIYSLPEPTTFNGVDTFIDTGVKLFDTAKDFTIVASGDFSQEQVSGNVTPTVFHCVYENGTWPGLSLTWNNHSAPVADSLYQFSNNDEANNSLYVATDARLPLDSPMFIITASQGVITKIVWVENGSIRFVKVTSNTYDAVNMTLILGAYQGTNGNKGRFWKGVLSEFKVYDYEMTKDQVIERFRKHDPGLPVMPDSDVVLSPVWSSDATHSINSGTDGSGTNYVSESVELPSGTYAVEIRNVNGAQLSWLGVAQYDANMNFIGYTEDNGNNYSTVCNIGATTKYARFSAYPNGHTDPANNLVVTALRP